MSVTAEWKSMVLLVICVVTVFSGLLSTNAQGAVAQEVYLRQRRTLQHRLCQPHDVQVLSIRKMPQSRNDPGRYVLVFFRAIFRQSWLLSKFRLIFFN